MRLGRDHDSMAQGPGFLVRLRDDRAGNTLAMIAAGVFPLLALVGGGVDMGRSYLAQSRLQQACDSAVLAARKKLGSQIVTDGQIPADVTNVGKRFFNANFGEGAYGTSDRTFDLAIGSDLSISGKASVAVPTTIMTVFGYDDIDIGVNCGAKLNFSNTDIMFVLDTTGSMLDKASPSDTETKIESLRKVVKNFHSQIESSKSPGTKVRYGFVPYSTNVNVGLLLKSDWMVDSWTYHGRNSKSTGLQYPVDQYRNDYTSVTGSYYAVPQYQTTEPCPPSTITSTILASGTNPDGSTYYTVEFNGDEISCNISTDGTTRTVSTTRFEKYSYTVTTKKTGTVMYDEYKWKYEPTTVDVKFLKGATGEDPVKAGSTSVLMYGYPSPTPGALTANFYGCVEERDTYEIDDYDNVDLSRALDLDIDLVPTASDPKTQWRPMLHEISFEPEIYGDGTGTFKRSGALSTNNYLMAAWAGLSTCPSPAIKLTEMDTDAIANYVDKLTVDGSTYHDIGMIWGGRLLSPTGLFAAENADSGSTKTSRHLIFLTDGETAPLDLSYGTYGIEPLDARRWDPDRPAGGLTLTEVVERRFGVACSEVKKRNITVWVIGFGVTLNPVMTQCAGAGHYFEAADTNELSEVFSRIAEQLGDLRIAQ